MMLCFGPFAGSGLEFALLLGLAAGVALAIILCVLGERYIFRSHHD